MTDREMIEMLMKQVESNGVSALTMVAYLTDPWKTRMQNTYDASAKMLKEAQAHLDNNNEEEN